jgi:transglutaminase-like putative cysteine protease
MVRLHFSIELHYDVAPPEADFIFNIHAAHTPQQTVVVENLQIDPPVPYTVETDPCTRNRYLRLKSGGGPLCVRYEATVDLEHHVASPGELNEVPVRDLPISVLPYIYPSRYCESDRLHKLANTKFGNLTPGYGRVQAICDWVRQHARFESNTSGGTTSALDTLVDAAGVCRDFSHLMIALCRALNIPARFATGIDYGANPRLGPTDFHAYVEVYLGHRWFMFDASGTAIPMGFVRFGTGRDASDCAFAMLFGSMSCGSPIIDIEAVPDQHGRLKMPEHSSQALSTDQPEPALA